MQLTEINVLIHPLYEYYVRLRSSSRPAGEKELFTDLQSRKRFFEGVQILKKHWGQKIQEIKGREKSMLVVFLPTSMDGLTKLPELLGLTRFAEKELGQRAVIIPLDSSGVIGQTNSMLGEMRKKGLNASSETRFNLFGEWKEDCIYDVENHLRFKMGIEQGRINVEEKSTLPKGPTYKAIAAQEKKAKKERARQRKTQRRGLGSTVTQADKEAEKKIIEIISTKFPEHSFHGEEFGKQTKNSEYLWTIDPIDGTGNFERGFPYFCVTLALIKNLDTNIGVTLDPCRKELFYAEKGKGAYLNGNQIHVSKYKVLDESTIGLSSRQSEIGKNPEILKIAKQIKMTRSSASDLANIAIGRMDARLGKDYDLYDIAAGVLLVREAGGKVTDWKNNEWQTSSRDLIASNGLIHEQIIEYLRKIGE